MASAAITWQTSGSTKVRWASETERQSFLTTMIFRNLRDGLTGRSMLNPRGLIHSSTRVVCFVKPTLIRCIHQNGRTPSDPSRKLNSRSTITNRLDVMVKWLCKCGQHSREEQPSKNVQRGAEESANISNWIPIMLHVHATVRPHLSTTSSARRSKILRLYQICTRLLTGVQPRD